MKGNAVSRYWQKQRYKKQYAKQAREAAKQSAAAAKKTAEATEKAASGIVAFVKRHPVGVALFAVLLLVLVLLQSCMSSMVSMGNGALGAVSASTYQAEDADIRAAERAYDELAAGTDAAVERSHKLAAELQAVETELTQTSDLMGAVVDYAKTRPVFDGYKASQYSKKYLAQHEDELATYRAARATMKEILDGGKLPRIDELKEKRRQLAAQKKALYMEYRQAQDAMREAVTVKANIDRLLGLTDERTNKEQER